MGPTIDLGLIYAIMALGVFLTYRVLNMPDLTVDGSFTTGAGTAAILITNGVDPWVATAAGFVAGALGGLATATLHTRLHIDPLLASILVMIALYSINLRIMGRANLPLLGQTTVFSPLKDTGALGTGTSIAALFVVVFLVKLALDAFLRTDFGLGVQATGDNRGMAASFGVSTDYAETITLMVANGLVGLSGAILAQYQGFADISMGIGMILIGLASVIVGQAVLSARHAFIATLGVVLGAILYRLVIFWALRTDVLDTGDMKLISALLVVTALVLSRSSAVRHWWRRRVDGLPAVDDPGETAGEAVGAATGAGGAATGAGGAASGTTGRES